MKKLDKDFMNFIDEMLDNVAKESDDLNLITFNNITKLSRLSHRLTRYVGDNMTNENDNDEDLLKIHALNNIIIQVNNILNDFIKENNIILTD